MKKRKSPCNDVCESTGPSGWCLGRGCTRKESAKWKKAKPYDANIIERQLVHRLSKIAQTASKVP